MKHFKNILVKFETQLIEINNQNLNELEKSSTIIQLCSKELHKLKEVIVASKFDLITEEIFVFKSVKSEILSQLLFQKQISTYLLLKTDNSKAAIKRIIKKELKKINSFFDSHREFMQYINSKMCYLDEYYFTRKHNEGNLSIFNDCLMFDPIFNTPKDELYAKVLAHKKALEFFNIEFEKIVNSKIFHNTAIKGNSNLQWTAPKSSLVELIYALSSSNAIDNGTADIKTIADTLQLIFNCELGDIYKTFSEIKSRQKSKTKFLDELTYDLNHFIAKSSK